MLYQILKVIARLLVKYYYKKVHIHGFENIPMDKPILLASNHPSGFMEPIILASFFPRPLYFLVRGDLFKNKMLRWLLVNTNQIPIFRFKDGFANLRNNSAYLERIQEVLKDGNPLIIYVEGGTESMKHLRPLQKGLARMAFDAMSKTPDLDLQVLPTGINFTILKGMNSEVMLNISEPIPVNNYMESYAQNPQKTIRILTEDVRKKLFKEVIHIENLDEQPLYEDIYELHRSQFEESFFPRAPFSKEKYLREKALTDQLNQMNADQKEALRNDVNDLKSKLTDKGLSIKHMAKNRVNIGAYLLLIIGFIPSRIGYIANVLPFRLSVAFANDKAKGSVFYTSIIASGLFAIYTIYYLILIIISISVWGINGLLVFVLPVLGIFFLYYKYVLNKVSIFSKRKLISEEMIDKRNKILTSFN